MIKRVTIINGKLSGNTRYNDWDIKTVPGKYLKWLAHSQYRNLESKNFDSIES